MTVASDRLRGGRALAGALAVLGAACHGARPGGAPAPAAQRAGVTGAAARRATPDLNAASAEQWRGMRVARVEELFVGRFAGVQVVAGPGGPSLRVRGPSTLLGSAEPLVVLDGMALSAGGLQFVSPADVERIEVLKDAGQTAFYGLRGANGVILITTRRPR